MNCYHPGKDTVMDEPAPGNEAPRPSEHGVTVTTTKNGDTAIIRVVGELREEARRPLVRAMTDLMLNSPTLRRVELDLSEVHFMNSAGVSTLVQLEKLAEPRGIEMPLLVHSTAVARPLQLSGLWRRFTIIDRRSDTPDQTVEPMRPGIEHR